MISRETESDLQNWGRWCNQGPWPHPLPSGRAASAEGRYIPPSDLGNDDIPNPPPPVNRDRALIVQSVYDHKLTQPERLVLRAEYPHRAFYMRQRKTGRFFDRAAAARKHGLPLRVYSDMLKRAATIVGRSLAGRN